MRLFRMLTAAVSLCAVAVLAPLGATAEAATGPSIDSTSLYNGGYACSAATPPATVGFSAYILQAVGTDASTTSGLTYTFALWPSANPAAETDRTMLRGSGQLATAQFDSATFSTGTEYSWHVQASDSNGTSAWSPTCTFTFDGNPPATTPTISSSNFPDWGNGGAPGPVGQLANFTFDAGGDPDTAGFQYSWGSVLSVPSCSYSGPAGQLVCPDFLSESDVIRLATPGGTASVTLNPPDAGPQTLTMRAMDRVGNVTRQVQYQIFVPYSGPSVSVTDGRTICGSSAKITFAPGAGVTGVVSYSYSLNYGTPVTVAANKKGIATVTIPVTPDDYALTATSTSTNGFTSSSGFLQLLVDPLPSISSDIYPNSGQPVGGVGQTGTFTFSPPMNSGYPLQYDYRFSGSPAGTVSGDSGTVQWTPSRAGTYTLTVTSTEQDDYGVISTSCTAKYNFVVASTRS